MNNVVIMGRLSREPDVRYSANGTCVARINVAVQRKFKQEGQPSADFINCIAFGKTGEIIERFFSKGQQIAVCGRIQTGSYEKDGSKVYTTDVVAESVEFVGSKSDTYADTHNNDNEAEDDDFDKPAKKKATKGRRQKGEADDEVPEGFESIEEEEPMPF